MSDPCFLIVSWLRSYIVSWLRKALCQKIFDLILKFKLDRENQSKTKYKFFQLYH